MDKQWRLGVDLHELDSLLNGITFDDVLTAVICNEPIIDEKSVRKVIHEIREVCMIEMNELLKKNISRIVAAAKKRRA
jgi:hypothetical protein